MLATVHAITGTPRNAIDAHHAGLYPALDATAGELRQPGRQDLVEPAPGVGGIQHQIAFYQIAFRVGVTLDQILDQTFDWPLDLVGAAPIRCLRIGLAASAIDSVGIHEIVVVGLMHGVGGVEFGFRHRFRYTAGLNPNIRFFG
jgi:hypothetical protein